MLRIGDRVISPRLVILDKDGTLIAFERLWHAFFEGMWRLLSERVGLGPEGERSMAESLGLDLATGEWDPLGPLTLAATGEVVAILASQLYRYAALTWPKAVDLVQSTSAEVYAALPMDDLLEPIGDVDGWIARLKEAGLLLALATADDRGPTEETLRRLGWLEAFDLVLCGDDGLPHKPAPDMAREICRRLQVPPEQTIMVGDTVGDLLMAQRAGLGMAVGVTTGALTAEHLADHADVVVASIHDIQVVDGAAGHDNG